MKKFLSSVILMLAVVGCSTQNREAAPLVDEQELNETLGEILENIGGSDKDLSALSTEVLADPIATLLYHTRDSKGAPVNSVFSITDMNALDAGFEFGTTAADYEIGAVDVIFIDSMNRNEGQDLRLFSLLIRLESYDGDVQYLSATSRPGEYSFSKTEFQVAAYTSGAESRKLILKSTDLSRELNNELGDSVKLKIYIEEEGQLTYVGQISTMAGFGNR
jgi:hypothetical protein